MSNTEAEPLTMGFPWNRDWIQRNAHASGIDILPDDVLLEIFLWNAEIPLMRIQRIVFEEDELEGDSLAPDSWNHADPSRHTRNASQVSSRWRYISLNSPTLWCHLIDCDRLPPRWFAEVLRRSQKVSLSVMCWSLQPKIIDGVETDRTSINTTQLLDSMCTLREIHLNFGPLDEEEDTTEVEDKTQAEEKIISGIFNLLPLSRKSLTKILISFPEDLRKDMEIYESQTLQADHIPPLDNPISNSILQQAPFPALTELYVQHLPFDLDFFLPLLSSAPELRKISISLSSSFDNNQGGILLNKASVNAVRLEHLTHIRLKGPEEQIPVFLNGLDVNGENILFISLEIEKNSHASAALAVCSNAFEKFLKSTTALDSETRSFNGCLALMAPSESLSSDSDDFCSTTAVYFNKKRHIWVEIEDYSPPGGDDELIKLTCLEFFRGVWPACTQFGVVPAWQGIDIHQDRMLNERSFPLMISDIMCTDSIRLSSVTHLSFPSLSSKCLEHEFDEIHQCLEKCLAANGPTLRVIEVNFDTALSAQSITTFDRRARIIEESFGVVVKGMIDDEEM